MLRDSLFCTLLFTFLIDTTCTLLPVEIIQWNRDTFFLVPSIKQVNNICTVQHCSRTCNGTVPYQTDFSTLSSLPLLASSDGFVAKVERSVRAVVLCTYIYSDV